MGKTLGGASITSVSTRKFTNSIYDNKLVSKSLVNKFHRDKTKASVSNTENKLQQKDTSFVSRKALPLKNKIHVKQKLGSLRVPINSGGGAVGKASSVSSVTKDIESLKQLQDRAAGMELIDIIELAQVKQNRPSQSKLSLNRYSNHQGTHSRKSNALGDLSFYNPSESQVSMTKQLPKKRQSVNEFPTSEISKVDRTFHGTMRSTAILPREAAAMATDKGQKEYAKNVFGR